jgi:hypothetical protein
MAYFLIIIDIVLSLRDSHGVCRELERAGFLLISIMLARRDICDHKGG